MALHLVPTHQEDRLRLVENEGRRAEIDARWYRRDWQDRTGDIEHVVPLRPRDDEGPAAA